MRNPNGKMKDFVEKEKKKQTPVIGIVSVAEFFCKSQVTVARWRASYEDFPVTSRENCIWETSEEALLEWKEKHIDLFKSRKEMADDLRRKKIIERSKNW